ncbi:hypothetical protein GQ457_04G023260 [Hibiscus cannabinus]
MMQPITSSISSLLPLFCFLVVSVRVPTTLSLDDPRYSECRTTLTCGSIENIGYPFWGMNRSSYCGPPGFELMCEDDVAKIMMNENMLRVLDINLGQQSLKVAREDYWNGYCPSELIDTEMDLNHFDYDPNLRNLTLFYGCYLPATSTFIFLTNCSINRTLVDVSYSTRNFLADPRPWVCPTSVLVPVYETAARDLEVNLMTMEQALRGEIQMGFADIIILQIVSFAFAKINLVKVHVYQQRIQPLAIIHFQPLSPNNESLFVAIQVLAPPRKLVLDFLYKICVWQQFLELQLSTQLWKYT